MAATRGRINDAPLYIDDSPNMTLVEIRAKCRRLKQREGLKVVVIDYGSCSRAVSASNRVSRSVSSRVR